jgi:uncharacterized membrane protein
MWIINFLPDWIFYLILLAGILGLAVTYFIRFIPIPAAYIYKTPIQLVAVAAIVLGTFMSGAIHNEQVWIERVKELEAKIAAAEVVSKQENVKIVEKVVKKTEYITRRGQDIVKYVDREIVKYDEKFQPGGICEIPKEFIKAHNDAAELPK